MKMRNAGRWLVLAAAMAAPLGCGTGAESDSPPATTPETTEQPFGMANEGPLSSAQTALSVSAISNPSWMERWVSPSTYLTELTLPGTHDSGALNDIAFPSGTANAQTLSLTEQLNAGVRLLDLRLAYYASNGDVDLACSAIPVVSSVCRTLVTPAVGSLRIFHGPVPQQTAESALQEITRFIDAHPREVVVISIKDEKVPVKDEAVFQAQVERLLVNHRGYFYGSPYTPSGCPSPGTAALPYQCAQGRIVLLRRYALPSASLAGTPVSVDLTAGWPDNGEATIGNGRAWVSDYYHYLCAAEPITLPVGGLDLPNSRLIGNCDLSVEGTWIVDKQRRVTRGLDQALQSNTLADRAKLRLLFTSATIFPANLRNPWVPQAGAIAFFATPLDESLLARATTTVGHLGGILMDRVTPGLVSAVVATNVARPADQKWGDYDGDGQADIVTMRGDVAYLYKGNGALGFNGVKLGTGWTPFSEVAGGADYDGDGNTDFLALNQDGYAYLYAGNGKGGFSGRKLGPGWTRFKRLVAGADFTSDGRADFLALSGDTAYLYAGDGRGHFTSKTLGNGWSNINVVGGARDWNEDGLTDFMAINGDDLYVYYGDGNGGFRSEKRGPGWSSFREIGKGADFDNDGHADFPAWSNDTLFIYTGNGKGGLTRHQIGSGWKDFRLFD